MRRPGRCTAAGTQAEDGRLARVPLARDQGGRPRGVRAAGGVLGRPGRRPGSPCWTRRPAGAMGAAREVLTADRRGGRRGPGDGPGRTDVPAGPAPPPGPRPAGRCGGGRRAPRRGGGGAARARSRRGSTATTWPHALRTARRGADGYAARWQQEVRRLSRSLGSGRESGAPGPDDAAVGLVAAPGVPGAGGAGPGRGGVPHGVGHRRRARRTAPGCAARRGWPSRSPTGPRTPRPPGCGWRRSSTRPRRGWPPGTCGSPARRSAGRTATWSPGPWSASGPSSCRYAPLRRPAPELVRAALLEGLRREGPGLLRWTRDSGQLRLRLAFLHRVLGAPWPDVSDGGAAGRAPTSGWSPSCHGPRAARIWRGSTPGQALRRLLPWATGDAARLDELAPERIEVPSGSRIRVDYGGEQPVLAVKLQELFGLQRDAPGGRGAASWSTCSPRPGGPRPSRRTWPRSGRRATRRVRAELRGRYPKHPWPEDPTTAEATRFTSARLRRD